MLRRRLMKSGMPDGFVDLGLPSGTLWAKGNICKDANGKYYIGEETDYGCYFSWGNIEGHNVGDGYNFNGETYYNTAGSSLTSNIDPDDASHDAALACLGSPWHMPTKAIFLELYRNTDQQKTTIDGVTGWKFMKKTDHSVYIFFPAAGSWSSTQIDGTEYCHYWTSTLYSDSQANCMSSSRYSLNFSSSLRSIGKSIRAVIGPQDQLKESYEEYFSVKFYDSIQDSYYGDSGSTDYNHSDIPCNMEFEALAKRLDEYYSGRKEYTTLGNVFPTATSMDISANVQIDGSSYYVDGYLRLCNNNIPGGNVDFRITSDQQDYNEGDDTFYFNIENDNGDVVGSGYCFFLDSGYAGVEITPN